MIDKVQKIREEVERLKGWNNNVRNSTRHMTLQEEDFNRGKHSSYLEILNFIDSLQEEPVSEKLGEIILEGTNFNKSWYVHPELAFKAGAKWKEEQFEKNRLKHCNSITNEQVELEDKFVSEHIDKNNRIPTFLDAIEYGMKIAKEQMMKEAVEGLVVCDELTHYYKDIAMPISDDLEVGDKVKLIIIKED